MSDIRILRPKVPGESLRIPHTGEKLPPEGKAVKMTTFWHRRLQDGSVVEVGPAAPTQEESSEVTETPAQEE